MKRITGAFRSCRFCDVDEETTITINNLLQTYKYFREQPYVIIYYAVYYVFE